MRCHVTDFISSFTFSSYNHVDRLVHFPISCVGPVLGIGVNVSQDHVDIWLKVANDDYCVRAKRWSTIDVTLPLHLYLHQWQNKLWAMWERLFGEGAWDVKRFFAIFDLVSYLVASKFVGNISHSRVIWSYVNMIARNLCHWFLQVLGLACLKISSHPPFPYDSAHQPQLTGSYLLYSP